MAVGTLPEAEPGSGNSGSPAMSFATLSPRHGETDVHTHMRTVQAFLEAPGRAAELITPFEAPSMLRRLVGLGMLLLRCFSVEHAWEFRDRCYAKLFGELGISSQVTFGGYVPQASRFLRGFRVYVHAARMENLPVSLIEALGCGLPLMVPAVGGIPEIVQDGVNGRFWGIEKPQQAADLLIEMLEDPGLMERFARGAIQTYEERFSADRIAPRSIEFIRTGDTREPGVGMAGDEERSRHGSRSC